MKELFERAESGKIVSHRDLHIILDALPVPLSWASLPGGQIQFVNRAFKRVFGYGDDSFATFDDWIDRTYVDESGRDDARRRWSSLWTPEAAGISEVDPVELRVRCADGLVLTVQHRGILLHDIGIGIATFEDVSARKQAEDAVHRIAFEDPLTGVGNRRALQARWLDATCSEEGIEGQQIAILLIDLDDFKPVNDSMGHEAGDAVLEQVAVRLRECVRGSDLVFRIGGDEFVILLPDFHAHHEVEALCRRIGQSFDQPFTGNDKPAYIGASIGASLWPEDGKDLRKLLRHADEALYRLKKHGKGGWQWFSTPAQHENEAQQHLN
ncbi:sensor domain-containing diguanylate cyclase [Sphingobium sp.]|uniref:sensor domain-containing diguanylate cyclase n=1 Tax=Sphingobium sp. TaxID=1912891 RepID=UPI000DB52C87|nr:sensor domain-containing diguanylate cyclase [Sphingobium sp.]PZU68670.1 MAG: sensor domain-containing diguanylate cyclase [Sphingobium sp.]